VVSNSRAAIAARFGSTQGYVASCHTGTGSGTDRKQKTFGHIASLGRTRGIDGWLTADITNTLTRGGETGPRLCDDGVLCE
jgi:hypothetical protein